MNGTIYRGHGGYSHVGRYDRAVASGMISLENNSEDQGEEPAGSFSGPNSLFPHHPDEPTAFTSPRMLAKEASERIERTAVMLSGLHDVSAALAVFRELPSRYHSRLVDRIVSDAMDTDAPMFAQVVAYFLHAAAQNQMCSAQTLKEGVSLTASILEDISLDVPDALSRYAIIVKAAGLHEDRSWRTGVLANMGKCGPEFASLLGH